VSNKYFAGNKGRYVFCDICGQACYAAEATELKKYTGRGGLIVCPNDIDSVDFGLIPYTIGPEKKVEWTRVINILDVPDSTPPLDYDNTNELGT